jgi:hypothetical protein
MKFELCRNPNFGLATEARGCKVACQKKDLWVTSHAPGNTKSVRERTLTLPSKLPCWELDSQMDSQIFRGDCRGQNPLPWIIFYIIKNLLKRRCLKWARVAHLDIWNTSYGQKKCQESNWKFDFRPLKVSNQPDFLHRDLTWRMLASFVTWLKLFDEEKWPR